MQNRYSVDSLRFTVCSEDLFEELSSSAHGKNFIPLLLDVTDVPQLLTPGSIK